MVFSTRGLIISFYQKEIITKSYLQRCLIEILMPGQQNKYGCIEVPRYASPSVEPDSQYRKIGITEA